MEYQYRYAALTASRLITSSTMPAQWRLPTASIRSILMEQDSAVDDLVITTSRDGYVFVQAKRSIRLADNKSSKYPQVIDAVARLYLQFASELKRAGFPPRAFDPNRDRIVLAVGKASLPLSTLARLCDNARSPIPFTKLAQTKQGRRVLAMTQKLVTKSWSRYSEFVITSTDVRSILSALDVHQSDCDNGGSDEDRSLELLRGSIFPAEKAHAVWNGFITLFSTASTKGTGYILADLLESVRLCGADVLGSTADHKKARSTLRQWSVEFAREYESNAFITIKGQSMKLRGETGLTLFSRAAESSLMLIGEPGIGKTGAAVTLYSRCREQTDDVVFLPVERLAWSKNVATVHSQLDISEDLPSVFELWGGIGNAYLIVDGLDSARGTEELSGVLRLLERIAAVASPRWRIVASMRVFDARRAARTRGTLSRLFPPLTGSHSANPLENIASLEVPLLSKEDLALVALASSELEAALTNPNIYKLARIPFNLSLLARVIESGVVASDLLGLRTELDLLDKYWETRISQEDGHQDEREAVLGAACDAIVRRLELTFDRDDISGIFNCDNATAALCSAGVLDELRSTSRLRPVGYRFSHNVLFDFALAKLRLRKLDAIRSLLLNNPGVITVIAPSLQMYFSDLWDTGGPGRHDFWNTLVALAADDRIGAIPDLIGIAVGTRRAEAAADLEGLIETLGDTSQRKVAVRIVAWLNGSLDVGDVDPFERGGEPWDRLVLALADAATDGADYQSFRLQSMLLKHPSRLTAAAKINIAAASRRMVDIWTNPRVNDRLISFAIQNVLQTFPYAPSDNKRTIKSIINPRSLEAHAWNDAPALARGLVHLHAIDPDLVAEVYGAIFPCREESREQVDMTGSRIFGVMSNRQQDLQHAKWELGNEFPALLTIAPEAATRCVIAAVNAYKRLENIHPNRRSFRIRFRSKDYTIREDGSAHWLDTILTEHEPAFEMLTAWCKALPALLSGDIHCFNRCLDMYLSNARTTVYWRKLLLEAAEYPATVGVHIAGLLENRTLLYCSDTTTAAGKFISAVYPHIADDQRAAIERAILQ